MKREQVFQERGSIVRFLIGRTVAGHLEVWYWAHEIAAGTGLPLAAVRRALVLDGGCAEISEKTIAAPRLGGVGRYKYRASRYALIEEIRRLDGLRGPRGGA